jgi:SAM-dependent methyltransferase
VKPYPPAVASSATREPEYRVHIGPSDLFDLQSAAQFNLLTYLGLREEHRLLDIGCGSLRAGRLFIPYLRPGHYFGIEPLEWLVNQGIDEEIGRDLVRLKQPSLIFNGDFEFTLFGQKFDFLLAQSIFSHASETQIRKCFVEAGKVMRPDALFAATFFQDERNYAGGKWTVKATYTLDRIRALAAEAGLNCEPLDWPHPDQQTWIILTHRDFALELPKKTGTERILQLEEENEYLRRKLAIIRDSLWSRMGLGLNLLKVKMEFVAREVQRTLRRR